MQGHLCDHCDQSSFLSLSLLGWAWSTWECGHWVLTSSVLQYFFYHVFIFFYVSLIVLLVLSLGVTKCTLEIWSVLEWLSTLHTCPLLGLLQLSWSPWPCHMREVVWILEWDLELSHVLAVWDCLHSLTFSRLIMSLFVFNLFNRNKNPIR
jgi:hypothetical protein